MIKKTILCAGLMTGGFLFANGAGAPPGTSGAPGEQTCASCHIGNAVNSGPGRVAITLPGGNTFAPGQKARLRLTIEDPSARAWGFILSARNEAGASSGTFAAVDNFTEPFRSDQRNWITHTASGLRRGTANSVTFEVDWTAPEDASGTITFYTAANAANANGAPTGDRIYTANLPVKAAEAAGTPPTFRAEDVREAFTGRTGIAPSTWITISGTHFSDSERHWSPVGGRALPTKLGNVGVTINDVPVSVSYVSPTKLTILTPSSLPAGEVRIAVETAGGSSARVAVAGSAALPAILAVPEPTGENPRWFASVTPAGAGTTMSLTSSRGWILGNPSVDTRAVRGVYPGEEIDVWATGLGRTDPAVSEGGFLAQPLPVAGAVQVRMGPAAFESLAAAMVSPGLYTVRIRVPEQLPEGDVPLVLDVAGTLSAEVLLKVQKTTENPESPKNFRRRF